MVGLLIGAIGLAEQSNCCNLPKRVKMAPQVKGMKLIKGGIFLMGCDSKRALSDEKPVHKVKLNSFWISETPVTNAQFAKFVKATGYKTTAEKAPTLEEILASAGPGVKAKDIPKEALVPASLVFTPTSAPITQYNPGLWWRWVTGASWQHPTGPDSSIKGLEDHPVVQVSWYDAQAYCKWVGGRLPTESEFEYAKRGRESQKEFMNNHDPNATEVPDCNVWQGSFPDRNTVLDGYARTSPVRNYSPNDNGLYDMAGNVWEWTSDWYAPNSYQRYENKLATNPQGCSKAESFDPNDGFQLAKKVLRGGSFLGNKKYCQGYRNAARMKTTPDSSTNHIGFRVVIPFKK
jgi:formylglycine-generating enzyme required for sulfatase activity